MATFQKFQKMFNSSKYNKEYQRGFSNILGIT